MSELSYNIYKNAPGDKRKGLNYFSEGGELPMFNVGGEQDNILRPLNTSKPLDVIMPQSVNLGIKLPTIDTSNEDKLVYYSGKQNIDANNSVLPFFRILNSRLVRLALEQLLVKSYRKLL